MSGSDVEILVIAPVGNEALGQIAEVDYRRVTKRSGLVPNDQAPAANCAAS